MDAIDEVNRVDLADGSAAGPEIEMDDALLNECGEHDASAEPGMSAMHTSYSTTPTSIGVGWRSKPATTSPIYR